MNKHNALKLGAVMALTTLVPATALAGQIVAIRSITAGDSVSIVGRHNSAGFTSGEGSVLDVRSGRQFLRAFLAQGATSASVISVVGLNSAGSPISACVASVQGPLPKDPVGVTCTGAVRYRTALTFAE